MQKMEPADRFWMPRMILLPKYYVKMELGNLRKN
jgi:hypothetical protein